MSSVWHIFCREFFSYLRSYLGYIILAAILLVNGLLFNGYAMGDQARHSYEVLRLFFYFSSGTVMIAGILVSMRLFAEERQTGTLLLLQIAPIPEWKLVLGKFLGAYFFLLLLILLSGYMPLLVMVHGKVTLGHLLTGYLGLTLLGATSVAIGTFASSIAPNQLISAVVGSAIMVSLLVLWMVAKKVGGDFGDFLSYLSLWDKHFQPFSRGILKVSGVLYYATLTYLFLAATTHMLGAQRWKS